MIELLIFAGALVLAGATLAIIAVVSLAIRREERDLSLTSDVASPAVRGARRLTGATARSRGIIYEVKLHRQDPLPLSPR